MSIVRMPGQAGVGWGLAGVLVAAAFVLRAPTAIAQAKGFTIEQALSAPYASDLHAAPSRGRLEWEANIGGRRNLWVAEPAPDGKGYVSRQVTHFTDDDGQEINTPEWTPEAASIVYVRGDSAAGENHPVPNPAAFPKGAQQQLWVVSAEGGEPRLLGEGQAPAVSPDGKQLAYTLKGQIWLLPLDDPKGKPEQLLQARGSAKGLRWSPDGTRLAFVSDRGDHSFVTVYSAASGSVTYVDPSTDMDSNPVWSPDSTRIAFLRIPPDKDSLLFEPHRTALPWSIRVVEVTTGTAHEAWRAAEGAGSAYRETDSLEQLHWTAGNRIVFPWERDGWLHLFSVPDSGGSATPLTPGNFEVEHVSLSHDHKTLVFDSIRMTSTDAMSGESSLPRMGRTTLQKP